jgi:hypothetical protein
VAIITVRWMGMVEELWKKVFKLGEEYREKVRAVVEEIAQVIAEKHSQEIESLAKELGVKIILSVKSENTNPVNTYPCLYLVISTRRFIMERYELKEKAERSLGDWASHARLRVEATTEKMEKTIQPKIKEYGRTEAES